MKAKSRLYKYTVWVSSTHLHVASPSKTRFKMEEPAQQDLRNAIPQCPAGPCEFHPSVPSRTLAILSLNAQQDLGYLIPQ